MHRLPWCRPPHRLSICKSILFRVSLTTREFNYQSHSASLWSDISCITGVVHEILKAVTIPCIVFRRVVLHIDRQFAFDPLPCLIDNERIQIPLPFRLLLPPEGRAHRRPNLEWRLKSKRTLSGSLKGRGTQTQRSPSYDPPPRPSNCT